MGPLGGFIIFFIAGAIIAFGIYMYEMRTKYAYLTNAFHQKVDKDTWTNRNADSSVGGLSNYISELDTEIADANTLETTKKLLLLRKAIALSTIRQTGTPLDQVNQAAVTLRSIFESKANNPKEESYRVATIPIYIYMLFSSCYEPTLGEELPAPYNQHYRDYLTKGYMPRAAVILAYRDFAYGALPPEYSDDVTTLMGRSFISAIYLYSFGEDKSKPENLKIFNDLKKDVDMRATLKPKSLGGYIQSKVDVARNYAFAFDIATSYMGTSTLKKEENDRINENYDNAISLANQIEGDNNSRYAINTLNSIYYLESLYKRYPKNKLDRKKVEELIDIFEENMLSSKEMKGLFTGFFIEGRTAEGQFNKVRWYFYMVAKNEPRINKILSENAGIKL